MDPVTYAKPVAEPKVKQNILSKQKHMYVFCQLCNTITNSLKKKMVLQELLFFLNFEFK